MMLANKNRQCRRENNFGRMANIKSFLNNVDVPHFIIFKMEIKILDNKKNRFMFELTGADHTLCNALKEELWNDKHVKVATYRVRHPQISSPHVIVETDGEETPKNALIIAVDRLHKANSRFKKEFMKEK